MADDEIDQTVKWLLPFYTQSSEPNVSSLNTALRKCLRMLAAKFKLSFKQDNVGNIYITSAGRDPELSPLGVCFPLDGSTSPGVFKGALRTFLALQDRSLGCGISLIGWSSPAGKSLGHDVWEGRISLEEGLSQAPDLKQFSSMDSFSSFGMSALFQIVVTEDATISIHGSPILVQKAADAAQRPVKRLAEGQTPRRAPEVRIEGREAVSVGRDTVELYSKYIAALFDNFD